MTILKVDTVSGIGTEGTVFEGDITFDSLNYMTLPKGTTTQSNRGRGIIGGGYVPGANTDVVDYIHIPTGGYANTFGTLTDARTALAGCASATRALFAGGSDPASSNIIDYITISTTGAAINFGDLSQSAYYCESLSNNTRGLFFGMADAPSNSPQGTNTIDYVTIASAGNTSNFGDLLVRKYNDAGLSSPTRGVMGGGWDAPAYTNVIEYVTIATTGNAKDWGDLSRLVRGQQSTSNSHGGLSE